MGAVTAPAGLIVAVDGGNSKTDAAVLAADGRLLGEARGPGASSHLLGIDGAVAALEDLIASALRTAGADAAAVTDTAMYLAGVDFDRERDAMSAAVVARGWRGRVVIDNDTLALLRTGTDGAGVAVVCGAGINGLGVGDDGRIVRFPSLGRISGDWGGGGDLGEETLSAAARHEDGRGPATALAAAVTAHFGTESVHELIEAVHFGDVPALRLHELSPVLFAVADAGDAVAAAIVDRLADEVAAMAVTAIRRLDRVSATVVLGGGILAARHPLLSDGVARRIADGAPGSEIVDVAERPIVGAALLALRQAGAAVGPDAEAALRRALGTRGAALV